MEKEEITPSEWQIMEILWASDAPLTSAEVYQRMRGNADMSQRMVRVLMNRLSRKDILGYNVDDHDARVYHYYALKEKAECVKEKSRKFVNRYFSGSGTNAVAAMLQSFTLTDEQIGELEKILEKSKTDHANSPDKEGGGDA